MEAMSKLAASLCKRSLHKLLKERITMKRRLSIVLALVTFSFVALLIGCQLRPNGWKTSTQEEDIFISGDKKIQVTIPLDQIGVLAFGELGKVALKRIEDDVQGRLKQSHSGNILIFVRNQPMTRKELAKLAVRLTAMHPDLIKKAGLVVIPDGAQAPMILTDELVVQFRPDIGEDKIMGLFTEHATRIVRRSPLVKSRFVLSVTERSGHGALEISRRFAESEWVKFAHPNFIPVVIYRETIPNDPLFGDQWHHRNTGAGGATDDADVDTSHAWDFSIGDPDVLIAVIDAGADQTHPDLTPNYWTNPGEVADNGIDDDGNAYIDDINGWDFFDNDGDLGPHHHGVGVAGCAAGRGDNTLGISGSCPNCSLMVITLGSDYAAQAEAIDYARVMGADIVTNSWGYGIGLPTTAVVETAVNDAATLGRGGLGCIVFFAMTNGDGNNCTGANPDISSIANVIAVSRSTDLDEFNPGGWGNCMDVLGPSRGGTHGIVTTDVQGADGMDPGDYNMNFGGTSAATPIVAGISGLLLDRRPALTRLQIQRLLQDTADKIEDSAGGYRMVDGFSSPAGADATHGYGRANGLEAVRILAEAADGGRNGVDIMLRDNRLDWGNTEQRSNVLFETPRGFIPHWESVDIKVDAPPLEAFPPTTSAEFEAFTHENPIESSLNRVYVRVRNRGPFDADEVLVKLHWTFAGTALPALPVDFWHEFPEDSADTSIWHPLGTQIIDDLGYSGASVAGTFSDNARIVQFDFPTPAIDPTNPNPRHHCLLAVIDTPEDPVSDASKASLVVDWITPRDNNVTHKNVQMQDSDRDDEFRSSFYIGNPFEEDIETWLTATGPKDWKVEVDKDGLDRRFRLKPGERVLVNVKVWAPRPHVQGDFTFMQMRAKDNETMVIGGVTLAVRSAKKKDQ
ncbi:MAG: S8 family serine peptidase [Desulfosarcinaceae bacterium]|nr:S8 family serine peptidase [Desulfosarcinaceae bacterium]